ncbi:MAG: DUF4416 family protein, partial [Candidatus Marinimicrobia bacterium]|nr:DUF4416 family protein [Candidatus Neomarinimicrobiota bacterium]
MGTLQPAPAALLFQAAAVNDPDLLTRTGSLLESAYGPLLAQYGPFRFDAFSSYYRAEMGAPLWKMFYIFSRVITPEHIHRYKLESQSIESLFSP